MLCLHGDDFQQNEALYSDKNQFLEDTVIAASFQFISFCTLREIATWRLRR